MLRCGSRLGGSRSAMRIMPPYLGCSPAAGPWAKAVDPPGAVPCTSRLAITTMRRTIPGMRSGWFVHGINHLLETTLGYAVGLQCTRDTSHHCSLQHVSRCLGESYADKI